MYCNYPHSGSILHVRANVLKITFATSGIVETISTFRHSAIVTKVSTYVRRTQKLKNLILLFFEPNSRKNTRVCFPACAHHVL